MPSFDGRVESYDKWQIEWAAFAEEEGLSGDSSVYVVVQDATGKLQATVVKTNKKAMAYLALAFDNMKLLRLITKAKSEEWQPGR